MKIALDAGHGLKTPGKQTPNGIKEWDINDAVRDKAYELLEGYDVTVIFPDNNEGNVDEGLSTRKVMYINGKVDAAVSIHHNALKTVFNKVTGVEVWVDKNATAEDLRLANLIYEKLVKYTGLPGRGIKRADFTVIYQNDIPAVLVEGGFMDGENDYKVITSEQGQLAYAKAVAEGLIEFLDLKKVANKNNSEAEVKTNNINSYTVKITTPELNVRKGPGTEYAIVTTVKENEVYTIVAESTNGWGNLKSGAGWISLKYTSKNKSSSIPVTNYYPACNSKCKGIVEALKSIGVDSSFSNRKKIATKNNVYDYEGTAKQNNQLLTKLKAGKLKKL